MTAEKLSFESIYRKIVLSEDLNGAFRLFGGRMMSWLDEAAALYVMGELKTQNIVTVKVSEISFQKPVRLGAYLEFCARTVKVGNTSIEVEVLVVDHFKNETMCASNFTFVHIDPKTEKPTPIKVEKNV